MPPDNQHDAYKTHQRKQERARDIDARVLLTAANHLEQARKPGAALGFYTKALQRNQRLWTHFQMALCDPANELPRELKRLLLNLARYVDKVSFSAIARYQPDLLESLVGINRRIAAGLSVKHKDDQPPATGGPPRQPPSNPPPPSGGSGGSVVVTA
ncbi:MAG TPA: flagellar biosynthesis regulator FlaF [Alphaproteobacteria bacterium]|nr:flagellar biosynthesis regulator FlaF [Alphaproteobacteria bacterium]